MDIDKLLALGFTVVGGQIDRGNVNYGLLTLDGPLLTPDGEALVQELEAPQAPKRGRPRKVEVEPEAANAP